MGKAIGIGARPDNHRPVGPADVRSVARASDGSSRLAFAAYRHGQWDLYSVDARGADLRQLTDDAYEDRDPAYSPTVRSWLLPHAAIEIGIFTSWTWRPASRRASPMTRLTTVRRPGARTGSSIAFESARAGNLDVWVLDVAGGAQRNLTGDSPAGDFAPAWSPDGNRIAFTSWRRDNKDLFVLDMPTGALAQLTDSQAAEEWPAWSPDGRQLAFVRNWLGEREVYSMDVTPRGGQGRPGAPGDLAGPGRRAGLVARAANAWRCLHHRWDGEQLLSLVPGAPTAVARPPDRRGLAGWTANLGQAPP